jgi:RNA polymerase sigma-70 factor (ECF subfamily)
MLDTLDDTLTNLTHLTDMAPHAKASDSRSLPAIHLHPAVERRMAAARPRLVRLARLQGVAEEGAEDVVQETLLEAWRSLDALHSPERFDAWLDGICRNVCRRWARTHATQVARAQPLAELTIHAAEDANLETDLPDSQAFDPEEALTRQELATLLDRALDHLHPSVREPLVLRYIAELPTAAISARLGLSVGAVEVRLHRGRRELREVLGGALRAEAEAFDIWSDPRPCARDVDGQDAGPGAGGVGRRETRIWCPLCGAQRLTAEIDWATGDARYWCATCGHFAGAGGPELVAGVRSYKPILSRVLTVLTECYTRGLATGEAPCACGRIARVEPRLPDDAPTEAIEEIGGWPAVCIHCPICGSTSGADIARLTADRRETQRFWRAHPRMRILLPRELEVGGVPALAMTVESVTDGARLDVIWARETLDVLAVYGAGTT